MPDLRQQSIHQQFLRLCRYGPVETTHSYRESNSSTTVRTAYKVCSYSGERVSCQLSLQKLIEEAYQIQKYGIAGPNWLSDDLFLFQATLPLGADKVAARFMMQHALAERFGLSIHFEQREVAAYALVPAKGGAKLEPAEDANHRKLLSIGGHGGAVQTMSSGQFSAVATSLELLAENLHTIADLDLPVVNMTSLEGNYKIDLHWRPTEDPEYAGRGKDPGFRVAVKEQLGLSLEKRRIPMTVLVVDHVNRTPSSN